MKEQKKSKNLDDKTQTQKKIFDVLLDGNDFHKLRVIHKRFDHENVYENTKQIFEFDLEQYKTKTKKNNFF